jgi:DNA primase
MELVQKLAIRQRNEEEIIGRCSICNGNDCHYNISTKNVWHCWNCDSSGRIIVDGSSTIELADIVEEEPPVDLAKVAEIRKLYTSIAKSFNSTLNKASRRYLNDRGFTDETIDKYCLGFCSPDWYEEYSSPVIADSGLLIGDFPALINRVTIPYFYRGEVVDIRGRKLDFMRYGTADPPAYMSLAGGYKYRGANYLYNHDVLDSSDLVIITEGEFKALAGMQHNLPIAATPGITRWLSEWTNQLRNKRVVLAADNELARGRRSPAYFQAKKLSKELPNLRVAVLPRKSTQTKVDVDSLILHDGVSLFKLVVDGAIDVSLYLRQEERKNYGRKH